MTGSGPHFHGPNYSKRLLNVSAGPRFFAGSGKWVLIIFPAQPGTFLWPAENFRVVKFFSQPVVFQAIGGADLSQSAIAAHRLQRRPGVHLGNGGGPGHPVWVLPAHSINGKTEIPDVLPRLGQGRCYIPSMTRFSPGSWSS